MNGIVDAQATFTIPMLEGEGPDECIIRFVTGRTGLLRKAIEKEFRDKDWADQTIRVTHLVQAIKSSIPPGKTLMIKPDGSYELTEAPISFDRANATVLREYVMKAEWFDPVTMAGRNAVDVVIERINRLTSALTAVTHMKSNGYTIESMAALKRIAKEALGIK